MTKKAPQEWSWQAAASMKREWGQAGRQRGPTEWSYNALRLSLLRFVIGIAFLFCDGKSIIGWVLTLPGTVIIFIGIVANLKTNSGRRVSSTRSRR